jgi:hypothetical protein
VVCVFVLAAREARASGAKLVSEPPFVHGEALLPSQPTEDLALEGGTGPPNLVRHIVGLQIPERVGVETFVQQLGVSEAARTSMFS